MAPSDTVARAFGSLDDDEPTPVPMPRDLADAISEISRKDPKDLQLADALRVAEMSLRSVRAVFASLDELVYAESIMLAAYLNHARVGLKDFGPGKLQTTDLPAASVELNEVVKNTESAANAIMGSAEAILAADPETQADYPGFVQAQVLQIFEACSFQDITGQRIRKIAETIDSLSRHVESIARAVGFDPNLATEDAAPESDKEKWRRENLVHGPQTTETAIVQNDVDSLFDQNDIDSLFD